MNGIQHMQAEAKPEKDGCKCNIGIHHECQFRIEKSHLR